MTVTLSNTPVIETERLILRAPVAEDWPVWREFVLSDRARFIRPEGDYSAREAWRGFGHVVGHWVLRGYGMFVFCQRGSMRPLGMAGPWYPEGWLDREIGWSVWDGEAEGRGFAFEAALAARTHAYETLGWDTAISYIDRGNARSLALATRLGAVHEPGAAHPFGGDTTHVYRHPAPGAAA